MNNTHILFISPTGTLDNGAEIAGIALMKQLVESGYRVSNIAPRSRRHKHLEYKRACQDAGILLKTVMPLKWWWEEAPGISRGSAKSRQLSQRVNAATVQEYIQQHDVSLVVTNTVNIPSGWTASKASGIPHYWLIHEFPSGEFVYYKDKLDVLQQSERVFAVKGNLQQTLQDLMPKKEIQSFMPFVHKPQVHLQEGTQKRLVCIGQVNERKNQLDLLKLKVRLPKDLPLVFIGGWDHEYKALCDQFISENKLENVQFLGYQENPWEQVTQQDICVFPSKMETFGLVYIEAALLGLPVVLTDNPGHLSAYELVKHGKIYSVGDVDALQNNVQQYLDGEALISGADLSHVYTVESAYHEILESIRQQKELPVTLKEQLHVSGYDKLNVGIAVMMSGIKRVLYQLIKR